MKPVNLNKARKAKDRSEKRAKADENAVKFGMTKAQKLKDKAQGEMDTSRLDAHKLDR